MENSTDDDKARRNFLDFKFHQVRELKQNPLPQKDEHIKKLLQLNRDLLMFYDNELHHHIVQEKSIPTHFLSKWMESAENQIAYAKKLYTPTWIQSAIPKCPKTRQPLPSTLTGKRSILGKIKEKDKITLRFPGETKPLVKTSFDLVMRKFNSMHILKPNINLRRTGSCDNLNNNPQTLQKEKKNIGTDFMTATEKMAQDIEKNGRKRTLLGTNGQQNKKRSLGAKISGSKFISPASTSKDDIENDEFQKQYSHYSLSNNRRQGVKPKLTQETQNQTNEIVDERLKNIDPKMIETVMNEIMEKILTITWDDIAGLEHAKNTIKEIVVWPMLRPDIFTGLRGPPKGILLFGPPGTGKTLIGKCIASQSNATFFSISSSSLTSKWVGDGEKMVRALFAVARVHQPSVIFIDEIDSLLTQRSEGEFEASRRIKTEFLVQFDGATTDSEDRILVIGATNRPQEIDEAARRRFRKRLYIPLPDDEARIAIVKNLLQKQNHCLSETEINDIGEKTKGYSGSDVDGLCREAAMGPIRSIGDIRNISAAEVRDISHGDFLKALTQIRASVGMKDLQFYEDWNREYGCLN